MNISVVIPVYNGAETLAALAERLGKVLPTVVDSYEVILVNDGSRDNSWEVIQGLSAHHPWMRGINLMRNYGQHNATLCGIRAARYELICTMDDDLQNLPEEMPKLIARLNEGYDVVYGVPRKRAQAWWKTLLTAWLKRLISYLMRQNAVRDFGAFKIFRSDLIRSLDSFSSPDIFVDVLLSWGTDRFSTVMIDEAPRSAGQSNYSLFKLVRTALLILTSYTTLPLRLASVVGFIFTIFGFLVLLYVLIVYFTLGSIPGFSFQASLISIFSGVQLFALGIMGEYLARMFDRSMNRPPYVIRDTVGPQQ